MTSDSNTSDPQTSGDAVRPFPATPGNVRQLGPVFVARRPELASLHASLGATEPPAVTLVHGPGGVGKTELTCRYAREFAGTYPAGAWAVPAEGCGELLPLIGRIALVPEFGLPVHDADRNNLEFLGNQVLRELRRRCQSLTRPGLEGGAVALLILDNVSKPELLGAAQAGRLPHPAPWLRVMATSRLGPAPFAVAGARLLAVPVGALSEDEALELVRGHQQGGRFASAREEAAAREIVRGLGGLTLAVEQVAACLGLHAGPEPPTEYLRRLVAAGALEPGAPGRHGLGPVLRTTLAPLADRLPAALTSLRFAARLPPDNVPWPWLREMTACLHPELTEGSAPWADLRRRLVELRLLTAGPVPQVARIHRLVAAHLQASTPAPLAGEIRDRARAVVAERVRQFRAVRQRLFNQVLTGDPDKEVTAWTVPSADVVMARAEAGDSVRVRPMGDGSYVLSLTEGAVWEEQSVRACVAREFAEGSVESMEWALRIGEVPGSELARARDRIRRMGAERPDDDGCQTVLGLALLAEAGAACRAGSDRTAWYLAGEAVEVFTRLRDRRPDDVGVRELLAEAEKAQWVYDW